MGRGPRAAEKPRRGKGERQPPRRHLPSWQTARAPPTCCSQPPRSSNRGRGCARRLGKKVGGPCQTLGVRQPPLHGGGALCFRQPRRWLVPAERCRFRPAQHPAALQGGLAHLFWGCGGDSTGVVPPARPLPRLTAAPRTRRAQALLGKCCRLRRDTATDPARGRGVTSAWGGNGGGSSARERGHTQWWEWAPAGTPISAKSGRCFLAGPPQWAEPQRGAPSTLHSPFRGLSPTGDFAQPHQAHLLSLERRSKRRAHREPLGMTSTQEGVSSPQDHSSLPRNPPAHWVVPTGSWGCPVGPVGCHPPQPYLGYSHGAVAPGTHHLAGVAPRLQ